MLALECKRKSRGVLQSEKLQDPGAARASARVLTPTTHTNTTYTHTHTVAVCQDTHWRATATLMSLGPELTGSWFVGLTLGGPMPWRISLERRQQLTSCCTDQAENLPDIMAGRAECPLSWESLTLVLEATDWAGYLDGPQRSRKDPKAASQWGAEAGRSRPPISARCEALQTRGPTRQPHQLSCCCSMPRVSPLRSGGRPVQL